MQLIKNRFVLEQQKQDKVHGILSFIYDTKPFHCKLTDTTIEYVYTDSCAVTIKEKIITELETWNAIKPAVYADGYGYIWDAANHGTYTVFSVTDVLPGLEPYTIISDQYGQTFDSTLGYSGSITIVNDTNVTGSYWVIPGDYTSVFVAGTKFVVTQDKTGTGSGCYTVLSCIYADGNTLIYPKENIINTAIATGFIYTIMPSSNLILDAIPYSFQILSNTNNVIELFGVANIEIGDYVNIIGSVLNGGAYQVLSSTHNNQKTIIEIDGTIHPNGGGSIITANTDQNYFLVEGDVIAKYQPGQRIKIKDNFFTVHNTIKLGNNTKLFVREPSKLIKLNQQQYFGVVQIADGGWDMPQSSKLISSHALFVGTSVRDSLAFHVEYLPTDTSTSSTIIDEFNNTVV